MAQAKFRQDLYLLRFQDHVNETKEKGPISMAEYAMGMARNAKALDPPMSDQEIVVALKDHFDRDVSRELRPSSIHNVEQLIDTLEVVEAERRTRQLRERLSAS